jgi:hypothetical protein
MVDLQAVSEKLVDRGERIVMAVTGATREEAHSAIEGAGGSVKTAVLMQAGAVDSGVAEIFLAEAEGVVRVALGRVEEMRGAQAVGGDLFSPNPTAPPNEASLERTLAAIRQLPKSISDLVRIGVDEERLRARPAPGKWSVKDQIEHLIVFDQLVDDRLRAILSAENPALSNWDENLENEKIADSGAVKARIEFLLMRLADGRAKLAARIEAPSAEGLARTGRHEHHGDISVYQLLRQLVWHDHHHLRAIRGLLAD